jgi:hypothetical protein
VELPADSFQAVWTRFLEVADTSKEVGDETLSQIVGEVSGPQGAPRSSPA